MSEYVANDRDYFIGVVVSRLDNYNKEFGKAHIQKLMHLIKCIDYDRFDIPFEFDMYNYGGYSTELSKRLDKLEIKRIIENENGYNLCRIDEDDLKSYGFDDHICLKSAIDSVIEILPSINFEALELYSTICYVGSGLNKSLEKVIYKSLDYLRNPYTYDKVRKAVATLSSYDFFRLGKEGTEFECNVIGVK